ncbi:hypothetical protein IGI04_035031 [Brassica rapa subsp. trilocularis]|uniref:Uncharacterized protein n=1 Tax=Brassica rapa subsp. trilocularis TaxID=1813537 RepID=A0ABQ7LCR1_BRACM|nr:hypothetical protein IGI04_035031 [Brassica rapa subsp. trilocularis]
MSPGTPWVLKYLIETYKCKTCLQIAKRSPRNCNFRQQNNAERLAGVAPASRSRATFSVSDGTNASDLGVSLQQVALNIGSDFSTSLWKVAPGSNMCVSGCENASDFSLREVAPGSARPKTTLITFFELQMHPNVSRNSMGTQIPDRDICMQNET